MNITYPIETETNQIRLGSCQPFIQLENTSEVWIQKIRIDVSLNNYDKYMKFGATSSRCSQLDMSTIQSDSMCMGIKCCNNTKAIELESYMKGVNKPPEVDLSDMKGVFEHIPVFQIDISRKQPNVVFILSSLSTENLEDVLEHLNKQYSCLTEEDITTCVNRLGLALKAADIRN